MQKKEKTIKDKSTTNISRVANKTAAKWGKLTRKEASTVKEYGTEMKQKTYSTKQNENGSVCVTFASDIREPATLHNVRRERLMVNQTKISKLVNVRVA